MRYQKNIYLCGFMGCGKSTVGKLVARRLGAKFIDLDRHIEKKSDMTISEIFSFFGEEHFRMLETESLRDFIGKQCIIATGGGTLLSQKNAEVASECGLVILIDTPFELCYERIKGDERRPIAFNSSEEQLRELYNKRLPLYRKHSAVTVPGDCSPNDIARSIFRTINHAF